VRRRLGSRPGSAAWPEGIDAEMRRLDRLASLGRLAAEVAHEIRNPLVSIKTFLQLLPERRDDPEFVDRFGAVVADELRRMERLLDLMLEQARPRAGAAPRADPAEAVAAVADLLRQRATRAGVELETRIDPDAPAAALGEDELRQVVLNLAQNALAVSPPGGRVRIVAEVRDSGLVLTVSDEGPGIPQRLGAAIFEPFVTGRADGSGGLGLAITRRIVEQAGGSIGFADRAGGGTEFRVGLPAAAGADPARAPGAPG
jgi:signal transduction histidine kinase